MTMHIAEASCIVYRTAINSRLTSLQQKYDLKAEIFFDANSCSVTLKEVTMDIDSQLNDVKSALTGRVYGPPDCFYSLMLNTPGINYGQGARMVGKDVANLLHERRISFSGCILVKRHISINNAPILEYAVLVPPEQDLANV